MDICVQKILPLNIVKKKLPLNKLEKLYPTVPVDHLKKSVKIIDKCKKVSQMLETKVQESNKILEKLGIEKTKHPLRCGHQAILDAINRGEKEIFIYGFSLISLDNKTYYNHVKGPTKYHNVDFEFKLLKILHKKGLIDATLCALVVDDGPSLDCSLLEPTEKCLKMLREFHPDLELKR